MKLQIYSIPLAWTAKLDGHFVRWSGLRAALDDVR